MLALLASYIVETNTYLDYQVKWVVANSENLLPHQINVIKKAFGVRPLQYYGVSEAVASASECENGKLHIDEDIAATEVIPDPAGFGNKVVGTSFSNLAVPLLRYEVGDVVTLSNERCLCGHPGRILATIDGRKDDYIVLKNGARLGGWIDIIFKDMVNIREAQIYQKAVGEIIIRVVPSVNYTKRDEEELLGLARKRVGDGISILVEYVERLERTSNGKLRCVVSEIDEGRLESVYSET
jgi:phenylacetate-CoA ligase